EETDDFTQHGGFYLWVETDVPAHRRHGAVEADIHPHHVTGEALATFLTETLHLPMPLPGARQQAIVTRALYLPSVGDAPLPSMEMLRYMGAEANEEFTFRPWQVCCHPLTELITTLNDLHFAALHEPEEFQLGADLRFWYQYT